MTQSPRYRKCTRTVLRALWHAVGSRLERGVRHHWCRRAVRFMKPTTEKLSTDEPSLYEYKRKLAIRDSALIEVYEFVSRLKLGVSPQRRDAVLALLDRAMHS